MPCHLLLQLLLCCCSLRLHSLPCLRRCDGCRLAHNQLLRRLTTLALVFRLHLLPFCSPILCLDLHAPPVYSFELLRPLLLLLSPPPTSLLVTSSITLHLLRPPLLGLHPTSMLLVSSLCLRSRLRLQPLLSLCFELCAVLVLGLQTHHHCLVLSSLTKEVHLDLFALSLMHPLQPRLQLLQCSFPHLLGRYHLLLLLLNILHRQ